MPAYSLHAQRGRAGAAYGYTACYDRPLYITISAEGKEKKEHTCMRALLTISLNGYNAAFYTLLYLHICSQHGVRYSLLWDL